MIVKTIKELAKRFSIEKQRQLHLLSTELFTRNFLLKETDYTTITSSELVLLFKKLSPQIPLLEIRNRDSNYVVPDLKWWTKLFKYQVWDQSIHKWTEERGDCDGFSLYFVGFLEYWLRVNSGLSVSGAVKWTWKSGGGGSGRHRFSYVLVRDEGVVKLYLYDSMYNYFQELKGETGWVKTTNQSIQYYPDQVTT